MRKSKLLIVSLVIILGLFLYKYDGIAQSPSFKTYTNPVIPGDHSDCTITQVGDDYYSTGSSFNPTPVIYHSTDLIHWEAIAQPVSAAWSEYGDAPQGGCWGGQVVYYKGKWWDFFGRAFTMYFVTADKPEGPWSEPVKMNIPAELPGLGADNSIFIDSDSSWYLLVKNGQPNNWIIELGEDGQPVGDIYDLTWLNPAPEYPYSWAEGPVMWKYKGYYFYSFARDVSGGQKFMRSKTLTGTKSAWSTPVNFFNETDPNKPTAIFSNPNHSSAAVLLADSTSWVLHPVWARANQNEWHGQGRQGLVNQVHYTADTMPIADYPNNTVFDAPDLPGSGIPWMVPKSDFFADSILNPEWSFLGYTPTSLFSLTQRPGWLRLSPKSKTKSNTVIKTDPEHNYSLITRLDFTPSSPDDEAGIRLMNGMENLMIKVYSSVNTLGHRVICFSYDKTYFETDNIIGNILWLKMVRINHSMSAYFSADGVNWKQVGKEIDVKILDAYSTDWNGWCGNRQGLYVQGSNSACFDLYIYRNAYTPILAECPANQFGTKTLNKTNGIFQLDSIHNNDWSLYAGIEFGNNEYTLAAKSVEITASSVGNGGIAEFWLDSIETGTKIGECAITSTGSWSTFQTFSAPVTKVQGRHDVYVRFLGTGTGRLFILKWLCFQANYGPELVSAGIIQGNTLQLKLSQPIVKPALPCGLTILANGTTNIAVSDVALNANDSSTLIVTLASTITASDMLTISYSSGTIANTNGIFLSPFSNIPADNLLDGALPVIKLLQIRNDGDTIWMKMSNKMLSPSSAATDFIIHIDGKPDVSVNKAGLAENDSTIIFLIPTNRLYYEDDVTLDYTGTSVSAINDGLLQTFALQPIQNSANGYPPVIVSATVQNSAATSNIYIELTFDRHMLDVAEDKASFTITADGENENIQSIVTSGELVTFTVSPSIKIGQKVNISYITGNVRSTRNGKLEAFTNFPVSNGNPSEINMNQTGKGICIYPNPVDDMLNISSETAFTKLSVLSTEGKLLFEKKFGNLVNSASINLSLNPGIYIIKLNTNSVFNFTKITVQ